MIMDRSLIFFLVYMFYGPTSLGFFMMQKGEFKPHDPHIAVGSTLVMNCSLRDDRYNASHIYFTVNNTKMEKKYVHIVNDKMAQLIIPNMTYGSEVIYCKWPGYYGLSQRVHVSYLPGPPQNLSCINFNWQRMTCTFQRGHQDPNLLAFFTVYFNIESPITQKDRYECPKPYPNENRCDWPLDETSSSLRNQALYYIQVRVKTKMGTAASEMIRLIPDDIVKPDPVSEIQASVLSSTKAELSWSFSPRIFFKKIVFVVKLCHENGQKFDRYYNTSDTSLTLDDLKPNSFYNISIQTIPVNRGFLSNASFTTMRTLSDVPAASPPITKHGFHLQPIPADPSHKMAAIFWKKLDRESVNGVLKQYRVTMTTLEDDAKNHSENIYVDPDHELLKYSHKINVHKKYAFTVAAASDRGYNESLQNQPIIISPTSVAPPEKVVAFYMNSSAVMVNWTQTADAEAYVVFWCYSPLPEQCKMDVDWQSYPGDSHSAVLTTDNRYMLFAVSVQRHGEISGMSNWTKCLYSYYQKSVAPSGVKLSNYQEGESLTVEWEAFGCHSGHSLYIIRFIISYCQVNQNHHCTGDQRYNISVDGGQTKHTIQDLEAGKTYSVFLYSVAPSGVSQHSRVVSAIVTHSGLQKSVVAGIAIGVVFISIPFAACLYFMVSKMRKIQKESTFEISAPPRIHIKEKKSVMFDEEDFPSSASPIELVAPPCSNHLKEFRNQMSNSSAASGREVCSSTDTLMSRLSMCETDSDDDVFLADHQRPCKMTLKNDVSLLQPVPEEHSSPMRVPLMQQLENRWQTKQSQPGAGTSSINHGYHEMTNNYVPAQCINGGSVYRDQIWEAAEMSTDGARHNIKVNSNNSNSYLEILPEQCVNLSDNNSRENQSAKRNVNQYINVEELNDSGTLRQQPSVENAPSSEQETSTSSDTACVYAELSPESFKHKSDDCDSSEKRYFFPVQSKPQLNKDGYIVHSDAIADGVKSNELNHMI